MLSHHEIFAGRRPLSIYYRFRTVFRVRNGIITEYGSLTMAWYALCLRLISPSDHMRARDGMSSYRGLFYFPLFVIRNIPPSFFQITDTRSYKLVKRYIQTI